MANNQFYYSENSPQNPKKDNCFIKFQNQLGVEFHKTFILLKSIQRYPKDGKILS